MELWIARDKDGSLYLYGEKPEREECGMFAVSTTDDYCALIDTLLPEITWENSPRKVKIELV